mgnify:CR=1 FL=1
MGMHGCGKHQSEKEFRRWERRWERRRNRRPGETPEQLAERRARWRAAAEASFYAHAAVDGGVITLLAFINLMTGGRPWFLWPAFGWGIGIFSHFMGVFGSRKPACASRGR